MYLALIGYVCTVEVFLLQTGCTWYMSVQPLGQQDAAAALFSIDTTMRSFFAQENHMQLVKFALDCLDSQNMTLILFNTRSELLAGTNN